MVSRLEQHSPELQKLVDQASSTDRHAILERLVPLLFRVVHATEVTELANAYLREGKLSEQDEARLRKIAEQLDIEYLDLSESENADTEVAFQKARAAASLLSIVRNNFQEGIYEAQFAFPDVSVVVGVVQTVFTKNSDG